MATERFLVTGASGCIGVWVLRRLLQEDCEIYAWGRSWYRLPWIFEKEETARIHFLEGDIARPGVANRIFRRVRPNRVIHLAGMLLPLCRDKPVQGARVNVIGTLNVFEAARRFGVGHLSFASTTSVYGPAEEYPVEPIPNDAEFAPRSLYGAWKIANEYTAKSYWHNFGISSIGLRPYVVYGAGRDRGLTATPSVAMLAAAAGRPYRISYGGTFGFHYAEDVAELFISAARSSYEGSESFNLGGESVTMAEVVRAIEVASPESAGTISWDEVPPPYPPSMRNEELAKVLPRIRFSALGDAVARTVELYRRALSRGVIDFDTVAANVALR
ncbi:MAG TPA: NAD-dependent epimerase/dehydratase family protein [Rectinemataceae bacterium]|nr:NAD-dependent epimerase/dehydratase family protein [Rectinemataceae bacterium]